MRSRYDRATLFLVQPFPRYGPPLATVPELRAAYEQGVRDRAAGAEPEEMPEHAGAYFAGRHELAPYAPLPWPVELAMEGLTTVLNADAERAWAARPRRPRPIAAYLATGLALTKLRMDAEQRRARALGLTAATAPRTTGATMFAAVPMILGIRLGLWLAGRHEPPVRWPETTAARLVQVIVRRYDWRRAGGP